METLAGNIILAQVVEYTGVYGLSILVFMVSYPFFSNTLFGALSARSLKVSFSHSIISFKTVNVWLSLRYSVEFYFGSGVELSLLQLSRFDYST